MTKMTKRQNENILHFRDCAGACGLNVALTIKDEQVRIWERSWGHELGSM